MNQALLHNHIQDINYLLYFFMICGVVVSSISGAIRAIEENMDIIGAALLAFLTANAGGTIRDLVLGAKVFWILDQFYIWITLGIGIITFLWVLYQGRILSNKALHTIFIITDAIGLAAFSLAGIEKSINLGYNGTISTIMGILTAVGGGVIADIVANRVPLVLAQELYVTIVFICSVLYIILGNYINHTIAGIITAFLIISLRIISVKYKLKLPIIKL